MVRRRLLAAVTVALVLGSMAGPHVAGVAALLSGLGLTNEEIVDCITSTALNPLTGARGASDPVYGFGIVDAEEAVKTCRPRG